MDFNSIMSASEKKQVNMQVDSFNKALNQGKVPQKNMGKEDFLKILVTQLSHQDPTKPMKDREFISQMAQFSSLEQMTNMSRGFSELNGVLQSSQAFNLLGKEVTVSEGDTLMSGEVEAVTNGQFPQVKINGNYYDLSAVQVIENIQGRDSL